MYELILLRNHYFTLKNIVLLLMANFYMECLARTYMYLNTYVHTYTCAIFVGLWIICAFNYFVGFCQTMSSHSCGSPSKVNGMGNSRDHIKVIFEGFNAHCLCPVCGFCRSLEYHIRLFKIYMHYLIKKTQT